MKWRRAVFSVVAPITALVVALLVSSVALLLIHKNPLTPSRPWSSYGKQGEPDHRDRERVPSPLYIAALAVAIGFKMNLFNIGVEGQYLLAACWWPPGPASSSTLVARIEVIFILVVAMVVGAIWAGIAGVLKVSLGIHEVISHDHAEHDRGQASPPTCCSTTSGSRPSPPT